MRAKSRSGQEKTELLQIRVTPSLRKRLSTRADHDGMGVSTLIRKLLIDLGEKGEF